MDGPLQYQDADYSHRQDLGVKHSFHAYGLNLFRVQCMFTMFRENEHMLGGDVLDHENGT